MNGVEKMATMALLAVVAYNAAVAAQIFGVKRELRRAAIDSPVPLLSGIRVDGAHWNSSPAPCRVIRFTSDDCKYCQADEAAYSSFLDSARQMSCEIVEIAPRAGGMMENRREGIVQLKFINTDLGPAIHPLVTPQTIVLGRDHTVKWMTRGAFSASSFSEGIKALRNLAEPLRLRQVQSSLIPSAGAPPSQLMPSSRGSSAH